MHHVLKQIVSSIILCQDCFEEKLYPRSMTKEMFEKVSIDKLLLAAGDSQGSQEKKGEEEKMQRGIGDWTLKDIKTLISGVSDLESDWEQISELKFDEPHSPEECLM
jgi:hypothetical protein